MDVRSETPIGEGRGPFVTRQRRTTKRRAASRKTGSLDDLHNELLRSDPKFRKLWRTSATKRAVAIALVRMRKRAGYTQAGLAKRAGWDKAFVSRLEGAVGAVPNPATLMRYAGACGHALGVVFASVKPGHTQITDAVTLTAPTIAQPFQALKGRVLEDRGSHR